MRVRLAVGCVLMFVTVVPCRAQPAPSVRAILREAHALAVSQGEDERFWTDRVLLRIADIHMRAGDFDGALSSILASGHDLYRDYALQDLAKALARDGRKASALDALGLLKPYEYSDSRRDTVQLAWIEHLIRAGDVALAGTALERIKTSRHRLSGLHQLALAHAKVGEAARAAERFAHAVEAAALLKSDSDRAGAWWEIAEAQWMAGDDAGAKTTIRRFVAPGLLKEGFDKVSALSAAATLSAKMKDRATAAEYFGRAIEGRGEVDELNKDNAIMQIAMAQAKAGFTNDALKTASMVPHSDDEYKFSQDGYREQALAEIAAAQAAAGDADAAVRTALSVKYFTQYRDDGLRAVVTFHVKRRDFKAARAAADQFSNATRKATAMLTVAAAQARGGDRKAAAETAARIRLKRADDLPGLPNRTSYDYRVPRTWGVDYEYNGFFTIASSIASTRRLAELAAASMALSQALGQKPAPAFAEAFDERFYGEVLHALARSHAATGAPNQALAWARQIGKAEAKVDRRIEALIGVAEGVLDRAGIPPREP